MIQAIKKLFTRDKSIELKMLEIIQQQQDFISKNINERVVYVDPQSGYTNVERFDDKKEKDEDEDEDFPEPHDMSPEELREQLEGNKSEGKK
jgi:hypothetical protein